MGQAICRVSILLLRSIASRSQPPLSSGVLWLSSLLWVLRRIRVVHEVSLGSKIRWGIALTLDIGRLLCLPCRKDWLGEGGRSRRVSCTIPLTKEAVAALKV